MIMYLFAYFMYVSLVSSLNFTQLAEQLESVTSDVAEIPELFLYKAARCGVS